MKELVDKYADKLVNAGFAERGDPLIGGLDLDITWNRDGGERAKKLERVLKTLKINSILFSRPAEPYRSIIDFLGGRGVDKIYPGDTETLTFLHDLPVISEFEPEEIIRVLGQRKSVIIPGEGIVTWGSVSPEQAFIFYSSTCFACFVKFFSDYLRDSRKERIKGKRERVFRRVVETLENYPEESPELMEGPFTSEEQVKKAIAEAGKKVVDFGLVDSFFGNISFLHEGILYISQTTSSLDELEGHIDPCPLDGSRTTAITASSEYTAHREIVGKTDVEGILHGHPKFSVIISMDCKKEDCRYRGQCHIKCPEDRFFKDIPIVTGEVGTGPRGLCNTLPPAMKDRRGVIVYGHGLFTGTEVDFNTGFQSLLEIEKECREEYFRRLKSD